MKEAKIKTYVLMVSTVFPAYHIKKGDPTNFIEQIESGDKIHTIRSNYELWKKRFEKINKGEAVLSIRSWEGKPYQSKQIEHFVFTKQDGIGIQKIEFPTMILGTCFKYNGTRYFWRKVAKNDGLSLYSFERWFYHKDLSKPMAIIHFTDFRY